MKKIALSLLALIMIFSLASCFGTQPVGEWGTVSYAKDTTVGKGAKTAVVEIVTEEKTVTITLKTDEEILGKALIAEKLIGGEEGAYGLYIKEVNGVVADYDADQTYWAFYIDGEFAMTGVDSTPIEEGKIYRLSKEKG